MKIEPGGGAEGEGAMTSLSTWDEGGAMTSFSMWAEGGAREGLRSCDWFRDDNDTAVAGRDVWLGSGFELSLELGWGFGLDVDAGNRGFSNACCEEEGVDETAAECGMLSTTSLKFHVEYNIE